MHHNVEPLCFCAAMLVVHVQTIDIAGHLTLLRPLALESFGIVAGRTRHWNAIMHYSLSRRPVPSDEPGDPGQTDELHIDDAMVEPGDPGQRDEQINRVILGTTKCYGYDHLMDG